MNASVLWDIVSRAKIECHEAAGRVAFYLLLSLTRSDEGASVLSKG